MNRDGKGGFQMNEREQGQKGMGKKKVIRLKCKRKQGGSGRKQREEG